MIQVGNRLRIIVDSIHPAVATKNGFSALEISFDIDAQGNATTSSIALGANPIPENE